MRQKKTKEAATNKAGRKKLKRRQQNKAARNKNKTSTKNEAVQQIKFILQCNFIYLECLTFLALIVITCSLYITLEKCYISMILCPISKPK